MLDALCDGGFDAFDGTCVDASDPPCIREFGGLGGTLFSYRIVFGDCEFDALICSRWEASATLRVVWLVVSSRPWIWT